MTEWIEIFRGGKQTDSAGREHDGDALIDKAVSLFDPARHEPPVVLGHPRDDAPAYGWVEALRRVVKAGAAVLEARFKDVSDELRDWVQQGRYRKRSASFYPDGSLRHVGFLGAAPPAVKGLAPVPDGFYDQEAAGFEFDDDWRLSTVGRMMRRLREWFIEEKGAETADRLLPEYDIETLNAPPAYAIEAPAAAYAEPKPTAIKEDDMGFTEQDVQQREQEAAARASAETEQRLRAEFAEARAAQRAEARAAEIRTFVETGVAAGRIAPAWADAGLAAFMERLDAEATIAFAEGAESKSCDAWFRDFLSALPKLIDFAEIATRDKDVGGVDAAGKLDALTRAKMRADKTLTYAAAFAEVQTEHPELVAEYLPR